MINDLKTITFDTQSLALLTAVGSVCVAAAQFFAARLYKAHVARAMNLCAGSFLVGAVGNLFQMWACHLPPEFWPRAAANGLILAGILGYYLAVKALRQEKANHWFCLAVLTVNFLLFSWFWFIDRNLPLRLAGLNVCTIAALLPLCTALFHGVPPGQRATWWASGVLCSLVLILLALRTVTLLASYKAYLPITDGLLIPAVMFKSAYLVMLVAGLFFMVMASNEITSQVSRLALLDSLTGIYNRRAFDELAVPSLQNSNKAGLTSTLLTLDLDHFKAINDRHGHAAGDNVLRTVTQAIAPQLRSQDIFARYGGEEFAILLPDTSGEMALMVAERLRKVVQELSIALGEHDTLSLTVSIGLATDREGPKNLARLVDESDRALYRAKSLGRNQVAMA